jgi:hypothetical protein
MEKAETQTYQYREIVGNLWIALTENNSYETPLKEVRDLIQSKAYMAWRDSYCKLSFMTPDKLSLMAPDDFNPQESWSENFKQFITFSNRVKSFVNAPYLMESPEHKKDLETSLFMMTSVMGLMAQHETEIDEVYSKSR